MCESTYIGQVGIKSLDIARKHRRQRKRSESLGKGDERRGSDARSLPPPTPIQRVVGIIGGLRDEDLRATFDEMMMSDICHNLRAGEDLDMELLLYLMDLLLSSQRNSPLKVG
jgi:hypothetical protein